MGQDAAGFAEGCLQGRDVGGGVGLVAVLAAYPVVAFAPVGRAGDDAVCRSCGQLREHVAGVTEVAGRGGVVPVGHCGHRGSGWRGRVVARRVWLAVMAAQAAAGRLKGADRIGVKVGKVINKKKVGKHFITDIADGRLSWRRDGDKIAAEAELDGIYVIRTSSAEEKLGTAGTVQAYKDLGNLERGFWSMKAEDTGLRPIYHYLENRVRAHVFLCMLATYLTWHLRQALAPLTFTDNNKPAREDPVIPARRSATATAKDTAKITPDKLPVRGYQELLAHLATLTRNTASFAGKRFEKLSAPTPEQRRAFDLLGKPIPRRLDTA